MTETKTILLVEDDLADQTLAHRALTRCGIEADLRVVSDGELALDYLNRSGDFTDPATSPRPDLVLLDLNLPRTDGREVLRQVRAQHDLRSIPIVVLSTSDNPQDIDQVYELGANSYITKPVDMAEYVAALCQVGTYWFQLVKLPRAS